MIRGVVNMVERRLPACHGPLMAKSGSLIMAKSGRLVWIKSKLSAIPIYLLMAGQPAVMGEEGHRLHLPAIHLVRVGWLCPRPLHGVMASTTSSSEHWGPRHHESEAGSRRAANMLDLAAENQQSQSMASVVDQGLA